MKNQKIALETIKALTQNHMDDPRLLFIWELAVLGLDSQSDIPVHVARMEHRTPKLFRRHPGEN